MIFESTTLERRKFFYHIYSRLPSDSDTGAPNQLKNLAHQFFTEKLQYIGTRVHRCTVSLNYLSEIVTITLPNS